MIDFEQEVLYGTKVSVIVDAEDTGSAETVEVSLREICQQFRYDDEELEDHGNTPRAELGPKVSEGS